MAFLLLHNYTDFINKFNDHYPLLDYIRFVNTIDLYNLKYLFRNYDYIFCIIVLSVSDEYLSPKPKVLSILI